MTLSRILLVTAFCTCQKRNETIESMMAAQRDNETRMARQKLEEVEQVRWYDEGTANRRKCNNCWPVVCFFLL